jgi:DNA-directed RNA polymerase subunit beta
LFLRALGLQDQEIYENIENSQFFKLTSQFDNSLSQEDCLLKIHSYLRPEESPTVKGCQQLLYSKFFDPKRYDLGFIGRYKLNRQFSLKTDENIHILTSMDVVHVINYLINFRNGAIQSDDIDHLGNRRIRSIGELLINQVRIGLNRLERIIHERMSICDPNYLRVNTLVNPKPFAASIREFFGSNPLSQFMDQTNPLAELTHKRRISVLGPGGITRDRAGFLIRDIHPSQYGRICPIKLLKDPTRV